MKRIKIKRKKWRILFSSCFILLIIFTVITFCFMNSINNTIESTNDLKPMSNFKRSVKNKLILKNKNEKEISEIAHNLPKHYFNQKFKNNDIFNTFKSSIFNIESYGDFHSKKLWFIVKNNIIKNKLFSFEQMYLGNVIHEMENAKIIHADLDDRGTQLKLKFILEGNQTVVFKPKWYNYDEIIEGNVYSGKDRYNAEIVAFYISGLLDLRLTPISTERVVSMEKEILPVATKRLLSTIDKRNNTWCFYGLCHYCKKSEPICEENNHITGAVIMEIPGKIKKFSSPWKRTYNNKLAKWEVNQNYCNDVKQILPLHRILDIVDASISDFLIQNGDRHHFETKDNGIILLDNGKGLGNPNVHFLDILAPLYQCCSIRKTTLSQLLNLSDGTFSEKLKVLLKNRQLIADKHLMAIEERFLLIFAAIEFCFLHINQKVFE